MTNESNGSNGSRFLLSFISAVLGAGVVAAILLISGVVNTGDNTTTVVQQAPLGKPSTASDSTKGLTARAIYEKDGPGVVYITSQVSQGNESQSPFDLSPQQQQQGTATGSGFVVDKDGNILTNAHVVEGATKVEVTLEDKKTVPAKIVGRDASTDIALIKIDPSGLKLTPLELGNSSSVAVGDPTVAIGNPFGLDRTLTTGVVSAIQRKIPAPNGFEIDNVIQTDAAINPGNSGGPLLDSTGQVIGINSQIETGGGGGNVGIGFAVPINTAKRLLPQLKADGKVSHAYLGIVGATIDKSLKGLNLAEDQGVLVQEVQPKSPASSAGIKAGNTQATIDGQQIVLGGDVITKVDGKQIKTMQEVAAIVDKHKTGDEISIELVRDGQTKTVTAKLGERPNAASTSSSTGQ